jgi:hypothetical protein
MSAQRLQRLVKLVTGLALVAAVTSGAATSSSEQAGATLNMNASLTLTSRLGACPAPPPGVDDCAARTISGRFPGLGVVTGAYEFFIKFGSPYCAANLGKALTYPIRVTVASKGEIHVAVDEGACVDTESIRTQTQTFTVTGGTGVYAGAAGWRERSTRTSPARRPGPEPSPLPLSSSTSPPQRSPERRAGACERGRARRPHASPSPSPPSTIGTERCR